MNDHDTNSDPLEQKLRELRPARPSANLLARLAQNHRSLENSGASAYAALRRDKSEREALPRRSFWWRVFAPVATAAAVVAVGMFLWHRPPADPPKAEKPFRQVESSRYFVGARDAGVVNGSDGQPYRVIRAVSARKSVWEDGSGTRVEQVLPQENIILVSMPVY